MRGAIAAGHPLTADAGARALEEGGNAVDACVAAGFASWVAESPLTGPGGGGFMLVHRARDRTDRVLDFFVAVPGLGRPPHPPRAMEQIDVEFDRETTQVFHIGAPSVAVPGTVRGLEEAHRTYGRLPWRELVQPAVELARDGVELTRAQGYLHAILDLILRHGVEGNRLYSRDGERLVAGDRLVMPDLARSLEAIGERGADELYAGELADAILRYLDEHDGELTRDDLAAYRVIRRRPVRARFRGHAVVSNPPPSSGGLLVAYGLGILDRFGAGRAGSAEAIATLAETMREQTRVRGGAFAADLYRGGLARRLLADDAIAEAAERVRARLPGVPEPAAPGGTTHISVVDARGNAASLSNSLGSGSGVIVPGTGIHLNNMLGEYDLVAVGARPGMRLTSMMAPSLALRDERPRLVVGSAGSVRLRGAIMQLTVNVIGHGMGVEEAIAAPRVHVEEPYVHCEGGADHAELDRLEGMGYEVVRWRRRNLYFGGAAAVEFRNDGTLAAAGDPRRGGAGIVVE